MVPSPLSFFGPLLIGVFFNAILLGVFLAQTYTYFQRFKKDSQWNRYLVIYLIIVETINTAMDIALIFEPLVLQFGSPVAFRTSPKTLPANPLLTAAASTPVQLYFAWRIRSITKSNLWPAVILVLSLTSLTASITTAVSVVMFRDFAQFHRFEAAMATWLGTAAVADVIITISLVYFLRKNKTGMAVSDSVVNKIITLTIETGVVLATLAAADVIAFLGFPGTGVWFIWDFSIAKLYAISLLANFNARAEWNDMIDVRRDPRSFIDMEKLKTPLWSGFERRRPQESPAPIRFHLSPHRPHNPGAWPQYQDSPTTALPVQRSPLEAWPQYQTSPKTFRIQLPPQSLLKAEASTMPLVDSRRRNST
ncbi:hypothetical protein C8J56DRAFT_207217 [Mycena floridula]|nr:hypothetical protein C8J56DRAFT_207217 [Mycena floridula]